MRAGLLVPVLLLVGCSGTAPEPSPACRLASAQHTTPTQQAELRARAKDVLAEPRKATAAQLKAVFEIVASQVTLPTALPSPLASALSPHGNAYGLSSLDTALQHLAKACR